MVRSERNIATAGVALTAVVISAVGEFGPTVTCMNLVTL